MFYFSDFKDVFDAVVKIKVSFFILVKYNSNSCKMISFTTYAKGNKILSRITM